MIDKHHKRISHVHAKDIRRGVVEALDRTLESFLDAVVRARSRRRRRIARLRAIVGWLAWHGYQGWFVVEAEQDPKVSPPLEMARKGHAEAACA